MTNPLLLNRRSMLQACAAGAAVTLGRAPADAAIAQPTANDDLIRNLGASGRFVATPDNPQAAAFDDFVGTWDVDYVSITDSGERQPASGQLIVGWVLDGRALQDIWIQETGDESKPPFKGTTLRFYDDEKDLWRVTFVAPIVRAVSLLEGRRTGNTIVLTGESPRGITRWSFENIEANRFEWRNRLSKDGGKTWRLREDHVMRRRNPRTG